jgi:hypothetical protein
MDIKNVIVFEVNKNDRMYSFSFPIGAPIGEIHDALYEMVKQTIEVAAKTAESIKSVPSEIVGGQ